MKIKFEQGVASVGGIYATGAIADLPDNVAKDLIANGIASAAKPAAKRQKKVIEEMETKDA